MSLDHHIADAVAAATKQISAQLEERLRALGSDIGQAASAERVSIVREIRLAAEAELAKKSQEAVAAAQADHARRLEEAVAAARTEAGRRLEEALAVARVEQAKRVEEAVASVRAEAQRRVDEAVAGARAEWGRQHDADRADWTRRQEAAQAEAARQHDAEKAEWTRRHEAEKQEWARRHESENADWTRRLDLQVREARAAGARDAEADLSVKHQAALAAAVAAASAAAAREAVAEHGRRAEQDVAGARAEAAQTLAEALARAREEHASHLAAAVESARAEARAAAESARAEALNAAEEARVEARAAERQAELALVERIADDIRLLDEARSLSDVLERLTDSVASSAPRAATFIVRAGRAVGWRLAGFPPEAEPRRIEFTADEANLVARAMSAGRPVTTTDMTDDGRVAISPFGQLPQHRAGLAVPIGVGGETVAVLYADDVSPDTHEAPSAWPEIAQILCRHAARCLEVLTVTRAVHTTGAVPPAPPPPRYAPQSRQSAPPSADDDDSARRYAKLLVSEIKLYHEAAVIQGRRDRNLLERLGSEIERARRLYEDRIPAETRARGDFFDQELVRTLAGGDQSLLGGR